MAKPRAAKFVLVNTTLNDLKHHNLRKFVFL